MADDDFVTKLGKALDTRRRQQEMFDGRQFVSFVIGCSHLFYNPGSAEAEAAKAEIKEEGTFKLVADSVTEFLAIFPVADPDPAQLPEQVEEPSQPNPRNAQQVRRQTDADQRQLRSSARTSGQSFRPRS